MDEFVTYVLLGQFHGQDTELSEEFETVQVARIARDCQTWDTDGPIRIVKKTWTFDGVYKELGESDA